MKSDDLWQRWLTHHRDCAPPDGLADRILARVEEAASDVSAGPAPSPSITLWERLTPFLLGTAAAVVCAVRVYSVIGLIVPPGFAFAADADAELQGASHVELAASDS